MTPRRALVIAAMMLLAALPAGADDGASSLAPAVDRTVPLPDTIDFGDGPRLPLTPIAAQLGVIVTITGERVNLVRPDGSELRPKGSLPDDPESEIGSQPPLILLRRGEAWVHARSLPGLLGLAATLEVDGSALLVGYPSAAAPPVTSFRVAKPLVVSPPDEAPSEAPPRSRLPRLGLGDDGDGATTDVAPVDAGLGLTSVTSFAGPGLTGFYQEIVSPGWSGLSAGPRELRSDSSIRRTLSYVSLDIEEGDQTYLLGDLSDPLLGTATGLGVRSDLGPSTTLGATLLVPSQQPGAPGDGQLALRAETRSGFGLTTGAAVATDGSYLLSGAWERPGASITSRLIDSYGLKRQDLAWEGQPLPAVNLYGRVSAAEGAYDATANLAGLQWRLGRARLGLDRTRGTSAGEPWGADSLSLSLHATHAAGTLRYLRAAESGGREGLEWYLSRFDARGRQFFFSSSAPTRGQWDAGRSYRLGASLPLRPTFRLRAAVDLDRAGLHPEAKLEWRPSRDKVIALRYGAFDRGLSNAPPETALVLQAGLAFGSTAGFSRGRGRIVGRVRDDRGRGVADVAVVLEDVVVTFTRADGNFEFANVEPGRHVVRIDPERLHAYLGGALRPRVVHVSNDGVEEADFTLTRLCRIAGAVLVQSASDAQGEPLAGATLELSNGRTATTDSAGRYTIGGLEPGRYTVSLNSTLNASLLIPISPTSWSFTLAPGDRVDDASFALERRGRPIIFDALPAVR